MTEPSMTKKQDFTVVCKRGGSDQPGTTGTNGQIKLSDEDTQWLARECERIARSQSRDRDPTFSFLLSLLPDSLAQKVRVAAENQKAELAKLGDPKLKPETGVPESKTGFATKEVTYLPTLSDLGLYSSHFDIGIALVGPAGAPGDFDDSPAKSPGVFLRFKMSTGGGR